MKGVGDVGVPVSAKDAKQLIEQAMQAPYGRGEETIIDTSVRRVWQLEPAQFSLRNAAWEPFISSIIETVRREFGIPQRVEGKLYKLLIYEKGSFFAPRRAQVDRVAGQSGDCRADDRRRGARPGSIRRGRWESWCFWSSLPSWSSSGN